MANESYGKRQKKIIIVEQQTNSPIFSAIKATADIETIYLISKFQLIVQILTNINTSTSECFL